MAYVGLKQYDNAVAAFQEALKLSKGQPLQPLVLGLLGYCQALAGNRSEAEKFLRQLQQLPPNRPFRAYGMAAIYTGLGDNNEAFHWLNESCNNRDPAILFLKVDAPWESLRNDPRFNDLLRRLGLIDKATAREQAVHSVAVLPFQNVGGEPKTEYLSDSVAEQIINNLSQVRRKELIVRPFTSVARCKGKPYVPTFGRELNVQMIVTGKLR